MEGNGDNCRRDIVDESVTDPLEGENGKENGENKTSIIIYGIEDNPSWTSIALMGLQHFSMSFSGMLTMPLLLAAPLCFELHRDLLSQLIATSFFMCGITTLLQTGLGSRLPILQGASVTFAIPAMVMMSMRGPCPDYLSANATKQEIRDFQAESYERIREIQGSLCLASLVQMIVGFSGLVGLLLPFIGPITIASALILIGIPIIPLASDACGSHWGISMGGIFLIVLFSQFLDKYDIPCPRQNKLALFTFFPILLAVAITWIFCLLLTVTGVLPDDPSVYGYKARTDIYADELKESAWIRIPYPGQWGMPTVTVAGFICMLAATIAGIVESVGDYHACAMICGAPPPPIHAINRGIGVEGVGCLAAGLWGSGAGYTSYSNNIAAIGITKVASRSVINCSAVIFMVAGIFAKFSTFCAALPEPVIGATMATTFGMVASTGLANLNLVKMNTSRNLFILGLALFAGFGVPDYLSKNPGAIKTGSEFFDQVLNMTLGTSLLVGGVTACVLDNLVRGSPEERGVDWRGSGNQSTDLTSTCYDLPFGMSRIKEVALLRRFPFSPTFTGYLEVTMRCRGRSHSKI